jgi:hypothetical protein
VQRFAGTNGTLTAREPFYRLGGDFDFGYHGVFNLYGLFMYGRDHNLLPVDSAGALVPLPLATGTMISGFMNGVPATFSGGFMQADYMLYPWMMLIMRWDSVHSTADLLNGTANFPLPFNTTRNRFTPGVQFLIHANIKASFEYQIRPQQSVTLGGNGLPAQPFRTNAVTTGLEFVY